MALVLTGILNAVLTPPTKEDFRTLQDHFNKAVAAATEVVWQGGYPVYPDSIPEFMDFVTSSPWCDFEYVPAEAEGILGRLSSANLQEICSVLTAIARAERFCDGSWLTTLTDGSCMAIIKRGEELLGCQDAPASTKNHSPT